ncbi:MAG: hypothetical protein IJQ93_09715 [Bacteroidales bacterium]|nr:hypothetical protein [Bacteroidales bacterium]
MDKNKFFKQSALRPTEEQRLLTSPFFQHANDIYRRFNDWKDIDRFYFIPLYLEMTYNITGIPIELAPDPVWLGTFVRCTMEHPDLFQYKCPKCNKEVLPFRYVGSPLSGRVDLEGYCDCGWRGFETVSGWFKRGEVLREQIAADKFRHGKYKLLHFNNKPASIDELMAWLLR